jgi:CBS domain-containing protein
MKIGDILLRKRQRAPDMQRVLTVEQGASVADAIDKMGANRVGALMVTDASGHIVGIFTERDIVRTLHQLGCKDIHGTALATYMTREVVYAHPEEDMFSALEKMESRRFRHLPVLDPQTKGVVGVISMRDLTAAELDQVKFERDAMEEMLMSPGVSAYVPPEK